MSNVGEERRWLQDILLSDGSDSTSSESDSDRSITEEDFQDMLKVHLLKKKYQARFYQKPEVDIDNCIRVHKCSGWFNSSFLLVLYRIFNISIMEQVYYLIMTDFWSINR